MTDRLVERAIDRLQARSAMYAATEPGQEDLATVISALSILSTMVTEALEALEAMLDLYGPPGTLRDTLEYPPGHPITKARAALSTDTGSGG